jgi:hypothetical protein
MGFRRPIEYEVQSDRGWANWVLQPNSTNPRAWGRIYPNRFPSVDEAIQAMNRSGGATEWWQVRRVRGRRSFEVVYTHEPGSTGGDDARGVREPRRPRPGSSAGAVSVDLPE